MSEHSYVIAILLPDPDDEYMSIAMTPCPTREELFRMCNELLDDKQPFIVLIDTDHSEEESRRILMAIEHAHTAHTN